jgi:hypothetical protein
MDALVETVPLTYGGSTVNKVYTCLSLFTGNAKLILFPIDGWLRLVPRDDADKQ